MALPAVGGAVRRSEFEGRELRESGDSDSGATDGRTDGEKGGGEGNDDNGEASVGFWPAAAQNSVCKPSVGLQGLQVACFGVFSTKLFYFSLPSCPIDSQFNFVKGTGHLQLFQFS